MLKITSIMIGSKDPEKMGAFYEAMLQRAADMKEEGWYGWFMDGVFLGIGEHSEVKETAMEPARTILNYETTMVKEEFERISKIPGSKVIKEPYTMMENSWIATIADPDGNYLQLMTPWEKPAE